MRADWFRAPYRRHCGGCHEIFELGTPLRQLRSGGIRCATCAQRLLGEDVPGDLAELPPQPTTLPPGPLPRAPFVSLPPLVQRIRQWIDVKKRQSGDDAA